MKRLLVTGSRNWTDRDTVQSVLWEAFQDLAADDPDGDVTLVHGDARGADRIAAGLWSEWGLPVEAHPALWTAQCRRECAPHHRRRSGPGPSTFCPAAGMYRNAEMVNMGADLCVAFILDRSVGASKCASLAAAAGVRVQRVSAVSAEPARFAVQSPRGAPQGGPAVGRDESDTHRRSEGLS